MAHAPTVEFTNDFALLNSSVDNGLGVTRLDTAIPDGHAFASMDNDIASKLVSTNVTDHPDLDIVVTMTVHVLGQENVVESLFEVRGGDTTAFVTLPVRADHDGASSLPFASGEGGVASGDGPGGRIGGCVAGEGGGGRVGGGEGRGRDGLGNG